MSRKSAQGIAGSKKLRLVKVVCQPIFNVDDGENLDEQVSQPITVSASEWPDFPERLEADRKETETKLNESIEH